MSLSLPASSLLWPVDGGVASRTRDERRDKYGRMTGDEVTGVELALAAGGRVREMTSVTGSVFTVIFGCAVIRRRLGMMIGPCGMKMLLGRFV